MKAQFQILVTEELGPAGVEILRSADDVDVDIKLGLNRADLLAAIPAYDGLIVRSGTEVDRELLHVAHRLKVIGRAGTSLDNIDIPQATQQGIAVLKTPDANSLATAEQTLGLMLALSRHIAPAHQSLLNGEWLRHQFVGHELSSKTVGIIGLGRVGRLVAVRAIAFGMHVIAYDPFVSEEVAKGIGVTLFDFDELLAQSDYVTLHAPQTATTVNLINREAIAMMKPGIHIINVARGKLINSEDLKAGLENGVVAGAAIDVYESEPPAADHPLIGHPRVLHTPHIAASTVEALHSVAQRIAQQMINVLRGNDYVNAVNFPFPEGFNFPTSLPYMTLAEKLGSLQRHLAEGSIESVEIEVRGAAIEEAIRPVAAAMLKGLLCIEQPTANYINAPLLAEQAGIRTAQSRGLDKLDYVNLISCRVTWPGGGRLISGALFGGREPRIVQVDDYQLEAKPEGIVLIMRNLDVPGVIGQIGTIMAAYQVNIGEWRMGRFAPGSEALSFINLDSVPPPELMDALTKVSAVTFANYVQL